MHVRERGQVLAVAVLLCHKPWQQHARPYPEPVSPNGSETSCEPDNDSEDVPILLHFVEAPVGKAAASVPTKRRRGQAATDYGREVAVVTGKKRPAPTAADGSWRRVGKTRTYTARKTEIDALLAELPALESYVDYLKQQAANAHNQINSTQKQQLVNSCLRDKAQSHEADIARVRSALSHYTAQQEQLVPFDSFIHLRKHKTQRLEDLLAVKPWILREASQFMKHRLEYTDLSVPSVETHSYVSPSGDYCMRKLVVMPLEGVTDVRQVFDKLKLSLLRLEEMISKATGDVTISEEDIHLEEGVSQHHLLRWTPSGYHVQSNEAVFDWFDERNYEFGDGNDYGVVAVNSVNKDELYPHCPSDNLQQDTASVITVRAYKRPAAKDPETGAKTHARVGVVLTHCCFIKLRGTTLRVAAEDMQETLERVARRGDVLFRTVRSAFVPSFGVPRPSSLDPVV